MTDTILSRRGRAFARCAAVIAAVVATAAPAQPAAQINVSAGGVDATRSRAVQIGDLNLADAGDRGRLDRRLKVAAGSVCEVWDMSTVRPPSEYGHCYSRALDGARSQVAAFAAAHPAAIPADS